MLVLAEYAKVTPKLEVAQSKLPKVAASVLPPGAAEGRPGAGR
jgi:hypothetical protein